MAIESVRRHDQRLAVAREAAVLARMWQPPRDGDVKDWLEAATAAELEGPTCEALLSAITQEADLDLTGRRRSFSRCIRGAQANPGSSFESMWRDDIPPAARHGWWPPAIQDLLKIYEQLDIRVDPCDIDSLTTELGALSCALRRTTDHPDAARRLVDHLAAWAPTYLRAVALAAPSSYYSRLAEVTCDWIETIATDNPTGLHPADSSGHSRGTPPPAGQAHASPGPGDARADEGRQPPRIGACAASPRTARTPDRPDRSRSRPRDKRPARADD
jgi:TorA maturation chaperone TorD